VSTRLRESTSAVSIPGYFCQGCRFGRPPFDSLLEASHKLLIALKNSLN